MSDTPKIPAIRKGLAASLFRIVHGKDSSRAEGIVVDIQHLRQQLGEVLELDPDGNSATLNAERTLQKILRGGTLDLLGWLQDNGFVDEDDRKALNKMAGGEPEAPEKQGKL